MQKILKSKLGFTLVELLVVLVIMSILLAIGVPIFNNVAKNGRMKTCITTQRQIANQAKEYCIDVNYNDNFNYKIVSDGKKGTIQEHEMPLTNDQINELTATTHNNDVLYCPSCGTFYITVTPNKTGMPDVKVTCDGGNDGADSHKPEK